MKDCGVNKDLIIEVLDRYEKFHKMSDFKLLLSISRLANKTLDKDDELLKRINSILKI